MVEEKTKVLVVEDENSIRKFININLVRNGFEVVETESGEKALEILGYVKPSIVVLDIMLPGIDGFEVCQKIKEKQPDINIIMLTARGQDMDKIMGLDLGADDYMVKPFNPLELVARIRAILRRTRSFNKQREDIILRNLRINYSSQQVFKNDVEVELTPTEFSLLKFFLENTGIVLSRDNILNKIWGSNYFGELKTVDVYVRRLREKVEDDPSNPKFIETVWGTGYRFEGEN